jgi:glycosyltransferase involved in cell wall biosynthesis
MRISFVLSSLRLSGGVRVILEYANRLAQRRHILYLVTPKNSIDLTALPKLNKGIDIIESRFPLKEAPSLWDKLALSISLSKAVPACDLVISTHTPTIVPAWLAARLWGRAKLFWLHQDYELMFDNRPIELFLLKHAVSWHDKVLAISNSIYEKVKLQGNSNVTFVGEGLSNSDLFQPNPQARQFKNSRKTIMYLGDSRPRKGLADFLRAMELVYEEVEEIQILIVSKEKLDLKTELPYTFIHLPTIEELANYYAASDLFVSASWHEGFGLPPLEAMACGTPVVLTDSGGVREFAHPGENCLMVPPRNPETLAEAIQRVLTNADLAERLRRNGPPTAARFSWAAAVDRLEAAFWN